MSACQCRTRDRLNGNQTNFFTRRFVSQKWKHAAIEEALRCKESGEAKTILFTLSGHGHFDMASYDKYLSGELTDQDYPEEALQAALRNLPKISR